MESKVNEKNSLTIKDIAALTGVHLSTVSRVINGDPRISEKTRKDVLSVVEKMDYIPNKIAQGLKTKKTFTLGMLIPDITNPFFSEVARGAEDEANKNGYNIILCNSDDKLLKERTYLEVLKGRRVDGLILGTVHIKDESVLKLNKNNFPYVSVSRSIEGTNKNCITIDDMAGGMYATEHLIKLNHRRIAHISGPLKTKSAVDRLKGYKEALKKYNIPYIEDLVVAGDFKITGGHSAMKKLLKLGELPTAIFAANDLLALGAMEAIREGGFNIPGDFSLVGFNDIPVASLVYPPLTTIRQPMHRIGSLAVSMLIKIIEERGLAQEEITLKPRLIIRQSTKSLAQI